MHGMTSYEGALPRARSGWGRAWRSSVCCGSGSEVSFLAPVVEEDGFSKVQLQARVLEQVSMEVEPS